MTRTLLLRGMLVGIFAGVLVFAFARWRGEPQIEQSIAFETTLDRAKEEAPEPEMVSRKIQKTIGLLTGVVLYGTAIGGLFALVFSLAYGRSGVRSPRALSALLAGLGFVAIVLVPTLKYPPNPPAVGNPETIGIRTAVYFLLILFSLIAVVGSVQVGRRIRGSLGLWNASLTAGLFFVIVISVVSHFLPAIDEVPTAFPATLLWRFRIAALEIQVVMWATLGLLFGWLTERQMASR